MLQNRAGALLRLAESLARREQYAVGDYQFQHPPVADMVAVGRVTATGARLWMRSERPGRLEVSWEDGGGERASISAMIEGENEGDNTLALDLPGDGELLPLTSYRYQVRHESGHLVGQGSFETAPASSRETPEKFSFAVMSCHQPFSGEGAVLPESEAMLRASAKFVRQSGTKLLLMVGDQMYSDYPRGLSLTEPEHFKAVAPDGRERLLDCSAVEVRRLYQERYRRFWNMPEMLALQAEYPAYLIWDDHDIIDNWGSNAAHQEQEWQALREGARRACYDYQASRVSDWEEGRAFDYPIVYGNVPIYVMDLRSERRTGDGGRLYSREQEERVRLFLEEHAAHPFVFIVLSVPIVHLPRHLTQLAAHLAPNAEDFSDRWSSADHVRDRDRFLRLIYDHQNRHPKQRVVFLSGDIHIGCFHELRWVDGCPHRLYQVISSGYTHRTAPSIAFASKALMRMTRSVKTLDRECTARVRFLRSDKIDGKASNPYGGLNFSVVEVVNRDGGETAEVRFLLYRHIGDEPVCVYRSPAIVGGRPL